MDKYIICDFARSNWGKTNTLLEVIDLMRDVSPPVVEESIGDKDKFAIFRIKGKMIVINTQGDPDSYQEEGLQRAVNERADIIICASRTRGSTVDCIYETAKNGYEIIWFSNLFADNENPHCKAILPEITAEAIINLIRKLYL